MQCKSCKYCVYRDYGYSNYTVEGTSQECGRGVHESFDRFYGQAPEIALIPVPCPSYSSGEPIKLDVDGKLWDELTEEEKAIAGSKF